MSSASDKLDVYRREEWRRLREDSKRLVRGVERTGKAYVAQHPYISLAAVAATSFFAAKTAGRRGPKSVEPVRPRRSFPIRVAGFLRPFVIAGLSGAFSARKRSENSDTPATRSPST